MASRNKESFHELDTIPKRMQDENAMDSDGNIDSNNIDDSGDYAMEVDSSSTKA